MAVFYWPKVERITTGVLNKKPTGPINKKKISQSTLLEPVGLEVGGNHTKAAELLLEADSLEPDNSDKTKWFVYIKSIDKETGEITPVRVLL